MTATWEQRLLARHAELRRMQAAMPDDCDAYEALQRVLRDVLDECEPASLLTHLTDKFADDYTETGPSASGTMLCMFREEMAEQLLGDLNRGIARAQGELREAA